jgi:hypothetical protein
VPPVPWDSFLANSKVPQGQTDEIITWMTKLHQKRQSIRSTRQRDLRKEALLESSRQAAATALQNLQQERMARWRKIRVALQPTPPPPPSAPALQPSLCDCDSCFLCRRHRVGILDSCYCSAIFSPRPVFMDLTASCASGMDDLFAGVAESREVDTFLASLGPCSRQDRKRKTENCWLSRKRCKA